MGSARAAPRAFLPCPLAKIRIPKSVNTPVVAISSAEIEFEIELVPNGYLLFGNDTKALEQFTYFRSEKNSPLTDEDYFELLENKTILNKHFVFVAFLRAFKFNSDLSQESKELYIGIVRSQKKRLLEYLVSNDYEDYVHELLINRIVTEREISKAREQF